MPKATAPVEKKKEKTPRPAKAETASEKKAGKTQKRKRNYSSYSSSIYKVLHSVHPDTFISKNAMKIMDSFVHDILDRIATEAGHLARANKRHTITSREIMNAVRLLLPGELAKHAVFEGTKAVTKFTSSQASADSTTTKP